MDLDRAGKLAQWGVIVTLASILFAMGVGSVWTMAGLGGDTFVVFRIVSGVALVGLAAGFAMFAALPLALQGAVPGARAVAGLVLVGAAARMAQALPLGPLAADVEAALGLLAVGALAWFATAGARAGTWDRGAPIFAWLGVVGTASNLAAGVAFRIVGIEGPIGTIVVVGTLGTFLSFGTLVFAWQAGVTLRRLAASRPAP